MQQTLVILSFEDKQVVLRAAQFGDTYKPNLNINHKVAMNGDLWATANPSLNVTQTLNFNWIARNIMIDLMKFLRDTAGKFIMLSKQNVDGTILELWEGKIITTPSECVHEGRMNSTVSLTFVGVKK